MKLQLLTLFNILLCVFCTWVVKSQATLPLDIVNQVPVTDKPTTDVNDVEEDATTPEARLPTLASIQYLEELYSTNDGLPNECRRGKSET